MEAKAAAGALGEDCCADVAAASAAVPVLLQNRLQGNA